LNRADHDVLLSNLHNAAKDIGRLRRLTVPDTSAWWAIDRIAFLIEASDAILYPSAAELYRDYLGVSGDEQVSIEEALRDVDRHARALRELLDGPEAERALRAVA
jgi:hypothetical protein